MKSFAYWLASLSPSAAAAIGAGIFFAFCILASAFFKWREGAEVRAIKRRRRRERKLIAETRAMLLRRHDPSADRVCYREVQQ